ncbi:hypothetical protein SporoP8_01600 [Sporosarcina ureae]|nr:hypothetical protein SporoP8_01600 [Sporosarcina ureae]
MKLPFACPDPDDPIAMKGYTYADSNLIMMTDPDGHFAQFIPLPVGGYRLYKAYKKIKNIRR